MIAHRLLSAGAMVFGLWGAPVAAQETITDKPWTLQEALGNPDGLEISGSVRVRYETLANQFRPGLDKNDDLISIQTRVAAQYDADSIRFGGELIDARAYDSDAGSSVGTGEVNALELVQAYVGVNFGAAFGHDTTTTLDAGRFVLNLGSRRLVGRNNFRNTTNAFTGARFEFRGDKDEQLTLFYTYPQQRLPSDKRSILNNHVEWDSEGDDLIFSGGFFSKPKFAGSTKLELYFYALEEDDTAKRNTRDRHIFTPGIRLVREPEGSSFDHELEYAYQFGEISTSSAADAPRQSVSAHFLHAEVGYEFSGAWKPRISFEYDLATGDGRGNKYGRFDSLFGPRRFDYGPSGIYGPLGRSNISSPGIRLELKPSKRWDAFLFYRAAWLQDATDSFASTGVRDPAGLSGTFGGHQIEARARYWVVPNSIRIEGGAAALFLGHFLRTAPNSNRYGDTVYSYVDLTANF